MTEGRTHRFISILFCDVVGSPDLSRELDPEDFSGLIAPYRKIARSAIIQHGGHVARTAGDSVMAFFGWPTRLENHAERSVRAAVALTDAMTAASGRSGRTIAVRAAVASGLVLVGASDNLGRPDVFGETANLAARLLAIAGPNEVLVAPGTFELTAQAFAFRDFGERRFKGFSTPVHVHGVAKNFSGL